MTGDIFQMVQKCATNAVTMTGNIFRMVSKCVPNALQNKDPAFSITACHQTRTTLTTCLERKMLTQKRNISLDTSLSYKDPRESMVNYVRSLPNNITKAKIRQEIKKKRKTGLSHFG